MIARWAAGASLALALMAFALLALRNGQLHRARFALERERAAHLLFAEQVRARSALAGEAFAVRTRRAENAAARITEEIEYDHQAKLDNLRRLLAALRLHGNADRAHPGGARSGEPDMPGLPGAAGRADAPAGDPGFSDAERVAATEQALRLESLQAWVKRQRRAASLEAPGE